MTPDPGPSVDLRRPRVIGAAGMAAFSLAAAMAWRAGDGVVALLFLLFALLALYLLLGSGQVMADGHAVTVRSALGRYRLAWADVRRVEGSAYGTLVLHAGAARLVVPPPLLWSGPHKQALRALIAAQLSQRALVVRRTLAADYQTHRNVRIDEPGSD